MGFHFGQQVGQPSAGQHHTEQVAVGIAHRCAGEQVRPKAGFEQPSILVTELVLRAVQDLTDDVELREVAALGGDVLARDRMASQCEDLGAAQVDHRHRLNVVVDCNREEQILQRLLIARAHGRAHTLGECHQPQVLQVHPFLTDDPVGGNPAGFQQLIDEAFADTGGHQVGDNEYTDHGDQYGQDHIGNDELGAQAGEQRHQP